MRTAVRENLVADGVVLEKNDHFAGRLHNLHGKGMKVNTRKTGRSTSMVKRVVCFRQGIGSGSKGGLGGVILSFSPDGHGRLFQIEFINPVPLVGCERPGMVIEPHAGQVMTLVRACRQRRFGWRRSLSKYRRRKTAYNDKRQRD